MRERRAKLQLCRACHQPCSEVVRFEHAAPYCRPCGELIATEFGWVMLQDRRSSTGERPGMPPAPTAPSRFRRVRDSR